MKKIIIFSALLLASCSEKPTDSYPSSFTDKLVRYAELTFEGDQLGFAETAINECATLSKIDRLDYPGLFLGDCGGFVALNIENALMTGDALFITDVYGLPQLDKYPERQAIFTDIARHLVKKRCAKPIPPSSCTTLSPMQQLGLK
jgi:hypothetical protein